MLTAVRHATGYEVMPAQHRRAFAENGWLLIPGALTEDHRAQLETAVDRVYQSRGATGALHELGFLRHDDLFGDLLTHPTTFPYVWGLLGWNIYSHHNHLDVTPPASRPLPPSWGWHQDGYRQNSDPGTLDSTQTRPMLSLKVAYVLSDLSDTGCGATKIIPGSHLNNTLTRTTDLTDPPGAIEVTAQPGDAFIFDRRLWHSRSPNHSAITRKMLFIGYTYRWIRPLDDMPIDHTSPWWAHRTPVQRQLLGAGDHTAQYWGIGWDGYLDDTIPLRAELQQRDLLDPAVPWLR